MRRYLNKGRFILVQFGQCAVGLGQICNTIFYHALQGLVKIFQRTIQSGILKCNGGLHSKSCNQHGVIFVERPGFLTKEYHHAQDLILKE